jgi:valacyclovir hydrolase
MASFEVNDVNIYYTEEGSGDAVLMLPGWAGSIDEFSQLRALLSPKYRVISADLPGSGKSGPQPRNYPATFYHDDARALLALLEILGATPAHIVGFSDGGEVALVMAEQQPDAVRSIVAWGAAGIVDAPPEMLDAFAAVVDAPAPGWGEFSGYIKAAYGEANARSMAQSFVRAIQAISEAGGDISRARAGEITSPVLLVTGEQDALAAPAVVSTTASLIPRGEFLEAKGAGHAVHHSHPDWIASVVVDWLQRH